MSSSIQERSYSQPARDGATPASDVTGLARPAPPTGCGSDGPPKTLSDGAPAGSGHRQLAYAVRRAFRTGANRVHSVGRRGGRHHCVGAINAAAPRGGTRRRTENRHADSGLHAPEREAELALVSRTSAPE